MRAIRLLACLLLPGCGVISAIASTPFSTIVSRNPFRLREEVVAVKAPQVPPLPKIMLTGLFTFGKGRALLKIQFPARPPSPAREEQLMLAEGEREGDLELLELDMKAGKVKLSYVGTTMEVCFADQKSAATTPVTQIAPATSAAPANQTLQPLSAEQQAILIEAMREKNKDNPEFPPLPPTIFTSADEP